jgi:hypothetical protein
MNATQIVGYTYNADMYCPVHVIDALAEREGVGAALVRMGKGYASWVVAERYLNNKARTAGIDLMDETSYDSGTFPKVIFASQAYMDYCASCGECLLCGTHQLMHESHC